MTSIKMTILKIGIVCLNALYTLMKIIPCSKKAVFISRQFDYISVDFKLINDELIKRDKQWKTVFLTKRIKSGLVGKIFYGFHIIRQMYHLATSKVVIIDGYCIAVSILSHKKSLLVIQIWHAIGCMKKFGYAMIGEEEGSSEEIAKIMKMHRNYDWALISSYSFINDYLEGFRISKDKILQIPLPKADLLSDDDYVKNQREKIFAEYPKLRDKKNILYCPTFRKNSDSEQIGIKRLIELIDFETYNFIYNPHPNSKVVIDDPNVISLPYKTMEVLPASDYVISDYSSVIYEAGLAKKSVFLYAYDWDEYSKKRSFNLDLEKDIPVVFSKEPQKIISAIKECEFDKNKFSEFIKDNVVIPSGGCTKAIVDLIIGEREENDERYNERNIEE